MSDTAVVKPNKFHYRGRLSQVSIYFGKLVRMFIYQNDWKVLPMSAVIAGLVSLVVKNDFFLTREGTLKGALAVTCVALWNGCFNSIQVICRERDIVKREHRSGMHVSAYSFAHLLFQAILCLVQSIITVFVLVKMCEHFPIFGFMTPFFAIDLAITVFLISFASDMISLFVSSLVHTTTAAMTVMPFLLIFQLVFSGGIFSVPEKLNMIPKFTVSSYGFRAIASQSDYNSLPQIAGWSTLYRMKDNDIEGTVTADQLMQIVEADNETSEKIRNTKVDENLGMTVGTIAEAIKQTKSYEESKNDPIPFSFKVQDIFNLFGEEKVKEAVIRESGQGGLRPEYNQTEETVLGCWLFLFGCSFLFFFLTMVSLKFIDKDKR